LKAAVLSRGSNPVPVGILSLQTACMKAVVGTLLSALLIACSTAHVPIVSKVPGDRREFEIVQVGYAPRDAAATITFSSSFGIFAFNLDPGGRKLKTVTFIVDKQSYCEGLTFQDRVGRTTDLLRLQGVHVRQEGTDLAIEIKPPAVAVLNGGGRVQYVNRYR
jgi:hypothetical protein